MPQTLAAFVAMLIALQLSLMQQRSVLNAQRAMMDNEIESIATGVGLDVLDHIDTKAFDAKALGGLLTDPLDLTPLPFDAGGLFTAAEDIDDFHEIAAYTYVSDFDSLAFVLEIEVHYVDEGTFSEESLVPTFAKEAVLTLTHPNLIQPITLSRVYTYP